MQAVGIGYDGAVGGESGDTLHVVIICVAVIGVKLRRRVGSNALSRTLCFEQFVCRSLFLP